MIVLALLSATALLGLSQLPPQKPVPGRCLTFLWTRTEAPIRIAMLDESAQTLRLARGKQMFDIARVGPGLFAGHGVQVTLDLAYAERSGLTQGAMVDAGSMRVEALGADRRVDPTKEAVSVPVGGMRSCA